MALEPFQLVAAVVLLMTSVVYYSIKLHRARGLVYDLQRKNLPIAPNHSFLFGHLLYLKSVMDKLPRNAHYQNAFGDIAREHFSKGGLYYIDLWPVSGLFIVNVSPNVATQIHANPEISMQRPTLLPRFFRPICGGPSLFDMPEVKWRPWRAVFTRGFNAEQVLSLISEMVNETLVYCETLKGLAAKGDLFHLDPVTLRFTIDVIGKTILNTSLRAQRGYNALADCMLNQIRWHQANAETNPLEFLNVIRWFVHWRNGRQMDIYIGKELDKRYNEYKTGPNSERTKAVIDLVLQAYLPEDTKNRPERLDPEFRAFAISQIRLFVFLGHDSTSSTICYILHLLSKNPSTLAQLRAEHDKLLGADLRAVPAMLKAQPHLANDLPYTTAVIKETLRLFPPGGASRQGKRGVELADDQGHHCPTENTMVFTIHTEMHRAPAYWKQPDDFLPERWLIPNSKTDNDLLPMKGAYRAFEIGPRNCVAQGFVMTELRVILALLVRSFDFAPAYEEWDRLRSSKGGTYRGERAYQIEEGAAHPVDKYPCRVVERM